MLFQNRIKYAKSFMVAGLLVPAVAFASPTADSGISLFVYILSVGVFAASLLGLAVYVRRLISHLRNSRREFGQLNNEWRRKVSSLKDPQGGLSQELADSRERMQIVLQCSGDAVIMTDARGNVEEMNPFAARMLDASIAEGESRPSGEVLRLLNHSTREGRWQQNLTLLRKNTNC